MYSWPQNCPCWYSTPLVCASMHCVAIWQKTGLFAHATGSSSDTQPRCPGALSSSTQCSPAAQSLEVLHGVAHRQAEPRPPIDTWFAGQMQLRPHIAPLHPAIQMHNKKSARIVSSSLYHFSCV